MASPEEDMDEDFDVVVPNEARDGSSNGRASVVVAMADMFPSMSVSRIRQVVEDFGHLDIEKIVDQLLLERWNRNGVSYSGSNSNEANSGSSRSETSNSGFSTDETNSSGPSTDEPSNSGSTTNDTVSSDSTDAGQPPPKRTRVASGLADSAEDEKLKMRVELLRSMLRDADPDFLEEKARELGDDEGQLQEWLNQALETRDYPKLVKYLKRKECKDVLQRYSRMTAEEFLASFPVDDYPGGYFSRPGRSAPSDLYKTSVVAFLKILFPDADETLIEETMEEARGLLVPAVHLLDSFGCPRGEIPNCEAFRTSGALDLVFIQEVAFLRLEPDIQSIVFLRDLQRQEAITEARATGALFECPICGDDDVLLNDVLECNAGIHLFCARCVKRQAEMAASEARPSVACLDQCTGIFTPAQLRGLLAPSLLNNLLDAAQQRELEEALGGELVSCPFCGFSCEIEDKTITVFECLHPACAINSCTKCKKVAHGTVPCENVETDHQTKARLLLEEKLTSALIRHCPRCRKQVLKVEGCNHMTCPCGAHFCYVCRTDITSNVLAHFDGIARCLLYEASSRIHRRDLTEAARTGREEVRQRFGDVALANDPTSGPLEGPASEPRDFGMGFFDGEPRQRDYLHPGAFLVRPVWPPWRFFGNEANRNPGPQPQIDGGRPSWERVYFGGGAHQEPLPAGDGRPDPFGAFRWRSIYGGGAYANQAHPHFGARPGLNPPLPEPPGFPFGARMLPDLLPGAGGRGNPQQQGQGIAGASGGNAHHHRDSLRDHEALFQGGGSHFRYPRPGDAHRGDWDPYYGAGPRPELPRFPFGERNQRDLPSGTGTRGNPFQEQGQGTAGPSGRYPWLGTCPLDEGLSRQLRDFRRDDDALFQGRGSNFQIPRRGGARRGDWDPYYGVGPRPDLPGFTDGGRTHRDLPSGTEARRNPLQEQGQGTGGTTGGFHRPLTPPGVEGSSSQLRDPRHVDNPYLQDRRDFSRGAGFQFPMPRPGSAHHEDWFRYYGAGPRPGPSLPETPRFFCGWGPHRDLSSGMGAHGHPLQEQGQGAVGATGGFLRPRTPPLNEESYRQFRRSRRGSVSSLQDRGNSSRVGREFQFPLPRPEPPSRAQSFPDLSRGRRNRSRSPDRRQDSRAGPNRPKNPPQVQEGFGSSSAGVHGSHATGSMNNPPRDHQQVRPNPPPLVLRFGNGASGNTPQSSAGLDPGAGPSNIARDAPLSGPSEPLIEDDWDDDDFFPYDDQPSDDSP